MLGNRFFGTTAFLGVVSVQETRQKLGQLSENKVNAVKPLFNYYYELLISFHITNFQGVEENSFFFAEYDYCLCNTYSATPNSIFLSCFLASKVGSSMKLKFAILFIACFVCHGYMAAEAEAVSVTSKIQSTLLCQSIFYKSMNSLSKLESKTFFSFSQFSIY